jgi:hypothetical protein
VELFVVAIVYLMIIAIFVSAKGEDKLREAAFKDHHH